MRSFHTEQPRCKFAERSRQQKTTACGACITLGTLILPLGVLPLALIVLPLALISESVDVHLVILCISTRMREPRAAAAWMDKTCVRAVSCDGCSCMVA